MFFYVFSKDEIFSTTISCIYAVYNTYLDIAYVQAITIFIALLKFMAIRLARPRRIKVCVCHVYDISFFSLSRTLLYIEKERNTDVTGQQSLYFPITISSISISLTPLVLFLFTVYTFNRMKRILALMKRRCPRVYVDEAGLMEIYTVPQSQQNFLRHTIQYYVRVDIGLPPFLFFFFFFVFFLMRMLICVCLSQANEPERT